MPISLFRISHVVTLTGLKRSTLYARIASGLFPAPVAVGPRIAAWVASEVEAVNSAIVSGATDTALKALVQTIHAERGYAPDPVRVAHYRSLIDKAMLTKARKRPAVQAEA